MAKNYTYQWARGKWADRAKLNYVPIDQKIDGVDCDTAELKCNHIYVPFSDRTPYRVEDTENGVIYMTYSSKDNAAIIKITEA